MSNKESIDDGNKDKRHFSRINFDTNIRLVGAKGSWSCHLNDISLKGASITIPTGWTAKVGDRFLVELSMSGSETIIHMEVSMMHIEGEHAGFRCEHIDLDSISHLRRLVELNLGDSDILNRELSDLIHQ